MKGNKKVLAALNQCLTADLTAMDVYFVQARMFEDWGLPGLQAHYQHELEEEQTHARRLIDRILFLEGTPDIKSREAFTLGQDAPAIFRQNLAMEASVVSLLKDSIALCEKEKDFQSRELLASLLADTEEDHLYWLEKQLGLITKVGLNNYLQSMISQP